jgi:hypothetical protein
MKTIKVKISDLKHPEKNVRKHSKTQLDALIKSYDQFGQFRPIVIDENNTILAGNGFVMAMEQKGVQEVEAWQYTNLTEKQKIKLMLADNKTADLGVDDMDILEDVLRELDGDFDIAGYDEEMLAMMIADAEEITNEVANYGVYSQEDIDRLKGNEQRMEEQNNAKAAPIRAEDFRKPEMVESPVEYVNDDVQKDASEHRFIICPKCGEKICLS